MTVTKASRFLRLAKRITVFGLAAVALASSIAQPADKPTERQALLLGQFKPQPMLKVPENLVERSDRKSVV